MTNTDIDITIPPEALEAAARDIYDVLEGPIANQDYSRQMRQWDLAQSLARAAILAALAAWQTEKHKMIVGVAIDEVGGQCPAIILPLPQKETSE